MNPKESANLSSQLVFNPEVIENYFSPPGFRIVGVEVTQAIQYHRSKSHLTDPDDREPDNSVRLIAGKPAWVRVYVRSPLFGGSIAGVTGSLVVKRRKFLVYQTIATLNPETPGSVTAFPTAIYSTERETLGRTLNFIIPADKMCGLLRLKALVETPGDLTDDFTLDLNVTLEQSLRVRGIMVGYNGPAHLNPNPPNLVIPAPTLADLQTTSAWTLLTFPVRSAATYTTAGTIIWNKPLTDPQNPPDGGCSNNWYALNSAIQAQKVADGNKPGVFYYGLLANGIPMGPVIGCASGGVTSGSNGNGVTMAHELGHACGLPHAPCGTTGDPNYPAYEPYDPANTPKASIGEYGLDISTGAIFPPSRKDLMSYCGPRWISLYNYGRLVEHDKLHPENVCTDPGPWWEDWKAYDPFLTPEEIFIDTLRSPVISIIGVLHAVDEIEVQSVMRLEVVGGVRDGRKTGLTAELIGADGKVLSKAPVFSLKSQAHGGCGCSGGSGEDPFPSLFQIFLPNPERGAVLRIRRGDKEVWSRRAPEREPRLSSFTTNLDRRGGLTLEWRLATSGGEEPEIWAQWSEDEGASWNALTTGLRGENAVVDASVLPSGRVQVRLLVSDGFSTAVSDPVAVEIPVRPPSIAILGPRHGQTVVAGDPLRLWGAATANKIEPEPIPWSSVRWLLDGQDAGEGLDLFITAPPEGEHTLTLTVTAGTETAEQSIRFTTVRLPEAEATDQ